LEIDQLSQLLVYFTKNIDLIFLELRLSDLFVNIMAFSCKKNPPFILGSLKIGENKKRIFTTKQINGEN